MSAIPFYVEDTHTYYAMRGSKRVEVPSVTQVIRDSGWMAWLDRLDPVILQRAQERGTRVHNAAEIFLRKPSGYNWQRRDWPAGRRAAKIQARDVECAVESLRGRGELGYLSALLKFLDESRAKVKQSSIERQFLSKGKLYAGRMDFECTIGRARWLIDIKSGGYEPAIRLQTAGYAYRNGAAPRVVHRAGLYLRDDGTYRLIEIPIADNAADWELFLAAVKTWYGKRRLEVFPK